LKFVLFFNKFYEVYQSKCLIIRLIFIGIKFYVLVSNLSSHIKEIMQKYLSDTSEEGAGDRVSQSVFFALYYLYDHVKENGMRR
jgi:hypothetical protein